MKEAGILVAALVIETTENVMHLEGSCHCGSVKFSVESAEPRPFMRCYCSICRKTAGGGGYAINLGADFRTMKVTGRRHLRVYRAEMPDKTGGGTHAHHLEVVSADQRTPGALRLSGILSVYSNGPSSWGSTARTRK